MPKIYAVGLNDGEDHFDIIYASTHKSDIEEFHQALRNKCNRLYEKVKLANKNHDKCRDNWRLFDKRVYDDLYSMGYNGECQELADLLSKIIGKNVNYDRADYIIKFWYEISIKSYSYKTDKLDMNEIKKLIDF